MIGAIIIIFGLYLVVWGKSKDYDSQSPIIKELSPTTAEHILPAKQNVEEGNAKMEHCAHGVIMPISNYGAGNIARDEQVWWNIPITI